MATSTVSPDKQYPNPIGPGLTKPNSWNGSLTDPNGLGAWLAGEYWTESTDNWQSPYAGGFGMLNWSSWAVTAGYAAYANDPVSTVPYKIQAAVAAYFGEQYFKTYGNWASVAAAWYVGNPLGQGYGATPGAGVLAYVPPNNNGLSVQGYINRVLSHMSTNSNTPNPAATPTSPTNVATGSNAIPSGGSVSYTTPGPLIPSPEPVNNITVVKPGPPLNLENLRINGTPLGLTQLGEGTLLDLISDCTIDQSVTELSTLTLTFQAGDAVLDALGLGIGNVSVPTEVAFYDDMGNELWPFVITSVQETANAAQQPAVEITCTSKLLQLWQGVFPTIKGAPPGSPSTWLYQQAKLAMGESQYADGRWVFAAQETRKGDPSFVVQVADPQTGTLQSSVYDVAQATQQDEGFYLFDSLGTTWFGEPSWITTKTQTVLINYAPAGTEPLDGTTGASIGMVSPVGPPELSMTIQTVPAGYTIIQERAIVRQCTVQLPQYIAAQIGAGFHVVLSGTGVQYDSNASDPWFASASVTAPASTTLGPQFPYIVTEVTGTVDGGLSTWTVTFQEAILPSQQQFPGANLGPAGSGTIGLSTNTPGGQFSESPPQAWVNPYTHAKLSTSGTKSHLASDFLGYAELYIGQPYVWGGGRTTNANGLPPITGTDCSGLVVSACRWVGIQAPLTSETQYSWCRIVPAAVAFNTPGALLFAEPGPGGPGHVCISAGNGHAIEAAHTGTNISYTTIQIQGSNVVETSGPGQGGVFYAGGIIPGMTYDMGINGHGAIPPPTSPTSPDSTKQYTGAIGPPAPGTKQFTTNSQYTGS